MPPKSTLWKHFEKKCNNTAVCRYCGKTLKTSGNTSNLKSHLESKHQYVLEETTATVVKPSTSKVIVSVGSKDQAVPVSTNEDVLPQNLSQSTILNAFKKVEAFKEGGSLNSKITQAIAYMICKDMEPIYMVEHEGFLHLMKTIVPQYKLPKRKFMKKYIEEKYEFMSTVVQEKLEGKKLTLTSDIWSDNNMQSFLSLTVHFFDGNEGIESLTIGVLPLSERHTGEYLAQKLTEWCSEWNITSNNVTAIVTDNAANIGKAVEIAFGSKKFIPCFAHTLNLIVESCLNKSGCTTLIKKAKKIVTWFKQSVVASDELRKVTDKKVIQSVPTRWNSVFYMLQRFIELRPFINDITNRHSKAPPMLTASELQDVNELIGLLEPFEAATKKMSGDEYLTTSLAIPIVTIIKKELDEMIVTKPSTIDVLSEAKKEMTKRFGQIEHSFLMAIATVLDPRFKRIYFSDATALAKVINFLSSTLKRKAKEQAELELSSAASSSDEPDDPENKKKKKKDLFAAHNKTVEKTWHKHTKDLSSEQNMPAELSPYLGAPPEKIETNPLAYWRDNTLTYPHLAPLATVYLTTIATSVPSERLFSKAGELKSSKRNRIKGDWLSKLIFLQSASEELWGLK